MISTIVLDASAAIHIVMATEHAADLAEHLEQAASVAAPDLYFSEVGNGLWKYVKFGTFPVEKAMAYLEEAMDLVDSIIPSQELIQEAVVAAARYGHPVYDMLYAILARRQGATILTMDGPFALLLRRMEIDTYCPFK